MARTNKTIWILLGFVLIVMVIFAWLTPNRVNWSPTYNTKDKIPLGLYVLDQEIDSFFGVWVERVKYPVNEYFYDGEADEEAYVENPNEGVNYANDDTTYDENIDTTAYKDENTETYAAQDTTYYDDYEFSTLLYINQHNNWISEEVTKVCNYVAQGNAAFISSVLMPHSLQDSLGINVYGKIFQASERIFNDTITIVLHDEKKTKIVEKNGLTGSYFTTIDSSRSQVLGYLLKDTLQNPNFIKVQYGLGHFFVHTEPAVFTNFFLLTKDFYTYSESALSHIPDEHYIIWSLNDQTSKVISDSPLRFIMSQPALKWAWYLVLAGIFMFIIFNVRRSQRVIPIIPKITNTSVEFVKTIGNMYFMEGDIRSMIDKKILYLLAGIRNEYHLSTDLLDEKFVHLLQLKSGKDEKIVKKMIFLVNKHHDSDYTCTIDDLNRLNTSIEHYYQ